MAPVQDEGDEVALYLRYQADIWVEVDTDDEDVVNVVVDELTMAVPVGVGDERGAGAAAAGRTRAQRIADSRCWPSWDYGSRPV